MTIRRTTPVRDSAATAVELFRQRRIAADLAAAADGCVTATMTADAVVVTMVPVATAPAVVTADTAAVERIRARRFAMAAAAEAAGRTSGWARPLR